MLLYCITNVQRFLTNFFRGVFGRAQRYLDCLCCIALCCILLPECLFDQFFSWSFWLSSSLPRLVVLCYVVLHFVVCLVLRRLVFICLICLSSLVA